MTHHLPLIIVSNHDEAYLRDVQNFLAQEGYVVVVTTTNLEAYTHARNMRPNAIILDVPLVGMDTTLSTLHLLRLDTKTHHIPVLICSMNTALITHNRAHLLKMNCSILLKPFYVTDLLQKVHGMLAHA